eukprot:4282882-Lingulodinium_polyedra.AAC.1
MLLDDALADFAAARPSVLARRLGRRLPRVGVLDLGPWPELDAALVENARWHWVVRGAWRHDE